MWQDLSWVGILRKNSQKPDCVQRSFWKTAKPEERFTEDTCDRRTRVKVIKPGPECSYPLKQRKEYARHEMVWPARNTPNSQVWRTGREDYSVSMACLTQGASRYTKGERDHAPVWPWVGGQSRLGQVHWVHQVWRNAGRLGRRPPGYGNVMAHEEWAFREWIKLPFMLCTNPWSTEETTFCAVLDPAYAWLYNL